MGLELAHEREQTEALVCGIASAMQQVSNWPERPAGRPSLCVSELCSGANIRLHGVAGAAAELVRALHLYKGLCATGSLWARSAYAAALLVVRASVPCFELCLLDVVVVDVVIIIIIGGLAAELGTSRLLVVVTCKSALPCEVVSRR